MAAFLWKSSFFMRKRKVQTPKNKMPPNRRAYPKSNEGRTESATEIIPPVNFALGE